MGVELNEVVDRLSELFGAHVSLLVTGSDPRAGGSIVTRQ
jgi:hypothetical protein